MRERDQRSLLAVRMVRERIEEREERALGEISRQVQRARETAERLCEELGAAGTGRDGELSSGAEVRQRADEVSSWQRQRTEAAEELGRLEAQRLEQMQRYRNAHADRRAIEELQEKRRLAHVAVMLGRERKASEELFLGRRTLSQQRLEPEMTER